MKKLFDRKIPINRSDISWDDGLLNVSKYFLRSIFACAFHVNLLYKMCLSENDSRNCLFSSLFLWLCLTNSLLADVVFHPWHVNSVSKLKMLSKIHEANEIQTKVTNCLL